MKLYLHNLAVPWYGTQAKGKITITAAGINLDAVSTIKLSIIK